MTGTTTAVPVTATAVVEEATGGTTATSQGGEAGAQGGVRVRLGKGARSAEPELNNGIEKGKRGRADSLLIRCCCIVHFGIVSVVAFHHPLLLPQQPSSFASNEGVYVGDVIMNNLLRCWSI